jgi:hypothetical protein
MVLKFEPRFYVLNLKRKNLTFYLKKSNLMTCLIWEIRYMCLNYGNSGHKYAKSFQIQQNKIFIENKMGIL